jgi:hypothetical protein
VEVLGVTDHHIFKSIYFFDPNGIRLELTAQLADAVQMAQSTAHAAWPNGPPASSSGVRNAPAPAARPSSPSTTTGRNTAASAEGRP